MNRKHFTLTLAVALTVISIGAFLWPPGQAQIIVQAPDVAESAVAVVQAAGRGNPWINLRDGVALPTTYDGPAALAAQRALEMGQVEPLSLAAADFDEDGVPDLVAGYGFPPGRGDRGGSGVLSLHRGNVDAIYPNSPEAQTRKAAGAFTDAPFLSPARVFELPAAPDFLAAGDFDNDGRLDALIAARGDAALYWLPGDGRGAFGPASRVALPGGVTALAVGEVNRRDGLADVVVGIRPNPPAPFPTREGGDSPPFVGEGPGEGWILVFEGPEGALRAEPEVFATAAPVTGLALGQLDDHYAMDIAVAAGSELLIVHGRDRKLSTSASSRDQIPPATVDRFVLPFAVAALAVGDFVTEETGQRSELALLSTDGIVHVLNLTTAEVLAQSPTSNLQSPTSNLQSPTSNLRLFRANISGLPADDLLVSDPVNRQLHIFLTGPNLESPISLDTTGEPMAVLPMRLNVDALDDLVILQSGSIAPAVALTAPMRTFTVNSADYTMDGDPDDNICDTGNTEIGYTGLCTLIAACMQANASAGADLVVFNIPGAGPFTVQPRTWPSELTGPVTIDATTQPGYAGSPVVELDGSHYYPPWPGLALDGGNSVIRGLAINRFSQHHALDVTTNGNIIEGNFIGIDLTGTQDRGSVYAGVSLDPGASHNVIGGSVTAGRNVISGNDWTGIQILEGASDNVVAGNYIGTDKSGTADVGNIGVGVGLQGGSNNTIGGTTAGARNVIAANKIGHGIQISAGAAGNLVYGNTIGADKNGALDLGNASYGVGVFNVSSNSIGGTATGAGNLIASNTKAGLYIGPGSAEMRNRVPAAAGQPKLLPILIADGGDDVSVAAVPMAGNQVQGNRIERNKQQGVLLAVSDSTIGGTAAGAGNTISGNQGHGVEVHGAAPDTIALENVKALNNGGDGIELIGVNLMLRGSDNEIAGNTGHGIFATHADMTIEGTGAQIHDNGGWGIFAEPYGLVGSALGNVTVQSGALSSLSNNHQGGILGACLTLSAGLVVENNGGPGIVSSLCDKPLTLQGVKVRNNTGAEADGILATTDVLIQGGGNEITGNGRHGIHTLQGDVTIQGSTQIHDNTGWGIFAEPFNAVSHYLGNVTIQSGALSSLSNNHQGGILGVCLTLSAGLVVENNGGPGIVSSLCDKPLTLQGVKVRNNTGTGADGILITTGSILIQGSGNEITGNGRHGIHTLQGDVTIQGSTQIHDNGGWGILAEPFNAVSQYLGNVTIQSGALSRLSHNHQGGVLGVCLTLPANFIVENNGGSGIASLFCDKPLVLQGVKVRNNTGAGADGVFAIGSILIQGSGNEISGNGRWGIFTDQGQVQIPDGATVEKNGRGGILASGIQARRLMALSNRGPGVALVGEQASLTESKISYNTGHGIDAPVGSVAIGGKGSEIAENGGWGIKADVGSVTIADAWVYKNRQGGILSNGSMRVYNTEILGSTGPGIASMGGEAYLYSTKVSLNSGHGIHALLGDVIIEGAGNEIYRNGGWGIKAEGGPVVFDNVSITYNGGNGVGSNGGTIQGRRFTIDNNRGNGVLAAGPSTDLTNGRICNNQGWGIVVTWGGVLHQAQVEICNNQLGGVHFATGSAAADVAGMRFPLRSAGWPTLVAGRSDILQSGIVSNTGDGVRFEGGFPLSIDETTIRSNAGFGLANLALGATVDARDNWWGAASGPGGIGPGAGDEVTGTVDFAAWRSRPVALVVAPAEDPVFAARGRTAANPIFLRNWVAPTDTVTVTLADTQGWLVGPRTFGITLEGELGTRVPVSFTVPVGVPLGAADTVTVTAVSRADPAASDTDAFRVIAALLADLAVVKQADPGLVVVGQNVTYTLAISNTGPDPASGVRVTDTLPAEVALVSAAASQGGCTAQTAAVTCALGVIGSAGQATVTVVVRTNAAGIFANTAAVTGNEHEPQPFDNSDTAFVGVNVADLSLLKTDSADPAKVGEPLTYTLIVANAGPAAATGVILTDTLPASMSFRSARSTAGGCVEARGVVTCDIGGLANGAAVTITIGVVPTAVGTIVNTASVTANEPDTLFDNTAAEGTTITLTGAATFTRYLPLVLRR